METAQKIEQLQAEIDAIKSFDKRHTLCSNNYIIELGFDEGKVSAAEKQDDGSWKIVSGIDAPQLSFTGNLYVFDDDWYINRSNFIKAKFVDVKQGQWYTIKGLSGWGKKNALTEIISRIRFVEMDNYTFSTMYKNKFGYDVSDFSLACEDFKGHTTKRFYEHPEDVNQVWPVEDRVRYLEKQIEKIKGETEIANATGFNKVIATIKHLWKKNPVIILFAASVLLLIVMMLIKAYA